MGREVRRNRSSVGRSGNKSDMLRLVERMREILLARFCDGDLDEFHAVTLSQRGPSVKSFADEFRCCGQPVKVDMVAIFRVVDAIYRNLAQHNCLMQLLRTKMQVYDLRSDRLVSRIDIVLQHLAERDLFLLGWLK